MLRIVKKERVFFLFLYIINFLILLDFVVTHDFGNNRFVSNSEILVFISSLIVFFRKVQISDINLFYYKILKASNILQYIGIALVYIFKCYHIFIYGTPLFNMNVIPDGYDEYFVISIVTIGTIFHIPTRIVSLYHLLKFILINLKLIK